MDPRAGTPAQPEDLVDVARLITAYYTDVPDPDDPAQQVSFGTSGHRGSSFKTSFNDAHIAATTQAIVEYRAGQGIDGPMLIGRDTHGLSEPAYATALEVLVANSALVQELTFQKTGLLTKLRQALPQEKIKDLRFKVGRIDGNASG